MDSIPFIVVEGPDGAGKSTLCDHLVAEFKMGYEHSSAPTEPPYVYYSRLLRRHPRGGAVIDRFHQSSWVYGMAFRNMDDADGFDRFRLDGELLGHDSFVIYCSPPAEIMDADLAKGPADQDAVEFEDPRRQADVRMLYQMWFTQNELLPWLSYDYTAGPSALSALTDEVSEILAMFKLSENPATGEPRLGSSLAPTVCLVGTASTDGELRYLRRAMASGGLNWMSACLVPRIHPELSSLRWVDTRVVALGAAESKALTDDGIVHTKLPSLAEVETLRYKDAPLYGRVIVGAEAEWPYAFYGNDLMTKFPTLTRLGIVTRKD